MKKINLIVLVLVAILFSQCNNKNVVQESTVKETQKDVRETNKSHSETNQSSELSMSLSSGTVLEILDAGGYMYLKIEDDKKKEIWIAVQRDAVKKGDKVEYVNEMTMYNYDSKLIKKTFDEVIFGSQFRVIE